MHFHFQKSAIYYKFCQSSEKSYMVVIVVSAAGQTASCDMVLLRYSKVFQGRSIATKISLKIAPGPKVFSLKNSPGTNFPWLKCTGLGPIFFRPKFHSRKILRGVRARSARQEGLAS